MSNPFTFIWEVAFKVIEFCRVAWEFMQTETTIPLSWIPGLNDITVSIWGIFGGTGLIVILGAVIYKAIKPWG